MTSSPTPVSESSEAQPVRRELIHTRDITCKGYLREDGLWDIEGYITDTKTYPFENPWKGMMEPGDPIHNMVLRLTVDEDLVVREAEATMMDTPYEICPQVAPNFARLVGLKIGKGWRKRVRELLGGIEGCTHLVELLVPLATTAFQSIRPYQRYRLKQSLEAGEDDPTVRRPFQIDTCHSWAAHRDVVRRCLPDYYTGDAPAWIDPEEA